MMIRQPPTCKTTMSWLQRRRYSAMYLCTRQEVLQTQFTRNPYISHRQGNSEALNKVICGLSNTGQRISYIRSSMTDLILASLFFETNHKPQQLRVRMLIVLR